MCFCVIPVYGLLSMSNNYFIYNAYNTFSQMYVGELERKKFKGRENLLVETLFKKKKKKEKEIRYLGT